MADKSRRNFIIGMAGLGALAAAGWGVAGWSFSRLSGTKVTQATSAFGEGVKIIFVGHWGSENVFGNVVERGYDDACALTGANCIKMYRPKTDADLQEIISNLQVAINQTPDVLITTDIYTAVQPYLHQASQEGIIVILTNVNAPTQADFEYTGAISFIGQSLVTAGYTQAQALSKYFPSDSHAVIIDEGPGQVWAQQRNQGIEEFLKQYGCTWDVIESSFDLSQVTSQMTAYLEAHPDTKAILSNGYGGAVAMDVFPKLGIQPGQIPVATFDITPQVLNAILAGYVTLTIDQQPYLQGFLPVIQGILTKKYDFTGWNVDTGEYVITKDVAQKVEPLVNEGIFY
ncbi:substrate-binding domain-containing protein [Saccharolobus islandicus]|uniref:Putative ABC transporter, periplasmic solute-binding protein n=1 Tax=Saccharolobus islandicus (strain M.16.27) TaxID=427318 RepID=C3N474_SACI3|nr:substrate-binding domain-containing protein [Sulfolobus islandicus]ACP54806.1 putative ABC transporter, periplasmic solute-binding protein [Sulfolobus islandicus M.16.27]